MPSYEYATVLDAPRPPATHIDPFHAAQYPINEKIEFPKPVHVIPS